MPQKEIKEKMIKLLGKQNMVYPELADQILGLFEAEKKKLMKEVREGRICLCCGGKKESDLSDWCHKCLAEN